MVVGVLGVGEGTGASPMKHTWGSDGWPTVSKVKDPISQEIDVMGSPTNYAPHDRPPTTGQRPPHCQALQLLNNQPLPSPIARKAKTTPRGVRSVVFILYPVRDSNPCYRRERPAS